MATHSSVLAWRIPGTGETFGDFGHGLEAGKVAAVTGHAVHRKTIMIFIIIIILQFIFARH